MALQPFGQIPLTQAGNLALFESGAIVLHIAERHPGLLPEGADDRAGAIAWMFAALGRLEPPIMERSMAFVLECDSPWYDERAVMLDERVRIRLGQLSDRLGDAEWLVDRFSAADLLMVGVLRRLASNPIRGEFPGLVAYVARGEAHPAFQRAFAAQRAVFEAASDL